MTNCADCSDDTSCNTCYAGYYYVQTVTTNSCTGQSNCAITEHIINNGGNNYFVEIELSIDTQFIDIIFCLLSYCVLIYCVLIIVY